MITIKQFRIKTLLLLLTENSDQKNFFFPITVTMKLYAETNLMSVNTFERNDGINTNNY